MGIYVIGFNRKQSSWGLRLKKRKKEKKEKEKEVLDDYTCAICNVYYNEPI